MRRRRNSVLEVCHSESVRSVRFFNLRSASAYFTGNIHKKAADVTILNKGME